MPDLNPVSIKTSLKLLQKIDAVITSCVKELLYWWNFAVPEYYFSYTKQTLMLIKRKAHALYHCSLNSDKLKL